MHHEILLIAASVTATMAIWAAIKLGMLTFEVMFDKHYSWKDKLGFLASLCVLLLGIASLGGVAKNTWESIQKTNATRQLHEEKIQEGIKASDAKLKFGSEEHEWKRVE